MLLVKHDFVESVIEDQLFQRLESLMVAMTED